MIYASGGIDDDGGPARLAGDGERPDGDAAGHCPPRPAEFRDLYKELVETNTTLSEGSCTLASERMAARLKAAGYPAADVRVLAPAERPKDGNLSAVLHGSDRSAAPMLLLAHIDVVEANRADWTRDPFTLVEEGGYFYARGASDDKAQAAIWVDTLVRLKTQGFRRAATSRWL
jgi:acetylornithine deacetylase/succinyl-diaminopimelate desuccinylase-like protein